MLGELITRDATLGLEPNNGISVVDELTLKTVAVDMVRERTASGIFFFCGKLRDAGPSQRVQKHEALLSWSMVMRRARREGLQSSCSHVCDGKVVCNGVCLVTGCWRISWNWL